MAMQEFDIKDLTIQNIFSLLKQINNQYLIITGWGLVVDGMIENFDECSYYYETGKLNDDELVEELFKNEVFDIEDGFYEFTANLIFNKRQTDEYGRVEIPDYYEIDNIEFIKKCTIQEYNESKDITNCNDICF
jgi:hypothetical protein